MALKKSFSQGSISGEYWRIDGLEVLKGSCRAFVALYTSEQTAKMSQGRPVMMKNIIVPLEVVSKAKLVKTDLANPSDPYKLIYPVLKALPEFSGAQDV